MEYTLPYFCTYSTTKYTSLSPHSADALIAFWFLARMLVHPHQMSCWP
jgi:hypothetical protein